ncbi:hypothetical protein NLX83_33680 [Allokutzneria sp. A3M-2-11 16]|uniref:hypothetical protein n=1 Tax=Allokutzneria sp. A3M-2-11 16 TaxID=2962043 RepID=UPI0020B694EA|nr:hypothetical protein [Allokutzneria sp. A3M-2-11 16]MCP3804236.1 hypothetical protein [Allokutzneria sp. A3M-2-11 16]
MRTHRIATVGLVCLTVALSTGAGPLLAQPPGQGPTDGVAVDSLTKERLAENAVKRTIDTCALLDPESVKEVFDAPPRDVTLREFDSCSMTVEPTPGTTSRSWSISVSTSVTVSKRDNAETMELHGRTFARRADRVGGIPDQSCAWAVLGDATTLPVQLSVSWRGRNDEPPPKPQCEVAKAYLMKLVPYWLTPSKRGEGATKPELVLPTKDPCAAIPELAKRFAKPGVQPKMKSISPYMCALEVTPFNMQTRTLPEEIQISFRWADNPAHQAKQPITVAGKPGSVAPERMIDKSCQVDVQYDPTMVPERFASDPNGRDVQVITVTAKTCDVAQPAAELVVKGAL